MAKIKGIELKSYKAFETSDGVAFTANIFIDGKKLGTVENRGYGGSTDVHLYGNDHKVFNERMNEFYKLRNFKGNEEDFVEELLSFSETEKLFKKKSKEKSVIILEIYTYDRNKPFEVSYKDIGSKHYVISNEKFLEEAIKKLNPIEHYVYRSFEDFNIQ